MTTKKGTTQVRGRKTPFREGKTHHPGSCFIPYHVPRHVIEIRLVEPRMWTLMWMLTTLSYGRPWVKSKTHVMRFLRRGPPKVSMSPENQWLEDVFPFKIVPFWGDILVFGSVCTSINIYLFIYIFIYLFIY